MMNNYIKLAKEIRKRDNTVKLGICVGEVTGYTPVTIRTYYNGVPFDFTEFYSLEGLMNDNTGITQGELYLSEYPYEIGDKYQTVKQSLFQVPEQGLFLIKLHLKPKESYL